MVFFFFQAEDGIRDIGVTGVQTCALPISNAHGEYYLTVMANIFHRARQKVIAIKTSDPGEVLGSNTRAEMMDLDARLRLAKCRELLEAGVTIFYPNTCVIDGDVEVGADTVIEPFVH